MPLPPEVARLIETFERNRQDYLHGRYSETQLRRQYLDPFFAALGWDVDNTQGYAEAYKDVIHEDAIRIGSATKAPDYCFRIGGTRKFFVEAKAPSVNLKENPEPAYQVRRYAWSAKLPLSILTDFEEFAVYDCRVRPAPSDKASKGRVKYYRYTDYADRWDEIASIFSREAVLKGSFDKYAVSEKRKQGTAEVDVAFLAEIEDWRDKLAHNIALRNPKLTNRELNYAVQITIDRVIFLRICEDRGIERYGELQGLVNGTDLYPRLVTLFRKADDRYNSGLFHFQREKDRHEGPDELTPDLAIDDKPLKEILRSLYYPDSPYEFSVLPAEILGQVYEQFLGKVIVRTSEQRARVEDKPEVKKAGGVFYTPSYIVDYIVKQTVGKLLEGASVTLYKTKPPKLDRPLRVLDPACGSGSFLLGAYQLLLDWHLDYYQKNDPKSWAAIKEAPICSAAGKGWKLTTRERKRILLEHIYGVDIDTQAVEVTKLSLLLKVLEGEKNLVLFHNERALPDLSDNIKCGNSLIGPDFYKGQQLGMFDEEERYRVNAFDWQAEFTETFKHGGFDVVIGNPPYIRVGNVSETQRPYLYQRYDLTHRFDIYVAFVQCGFSLLNKSGYLGFIVPNKFITAEYGMSLRRLLATTRSVHSIIDFGDSQVFRDATTYTCLLFLRRNDSNQFEYVQACADTPHGIWHPTRRTTITTHNLSETPWTLVDNTAGEILQRMAAFPQLGAHAIISRGLETGCDDVFLLQSTREAQDGGEHVSVRSGVEDHPFQIERAAIRRVVKGAVDVRRYYIEESSRWILFPYSQTADGPVLIGAAQFAERFPLAWDYLQRHVSQLRRCKGEKWYAYRRRNYDLAEGNARLLVPSIGQRACFAYEPSGMIHYIGSGGGGGGGYGLTLKNRADISILYLLGLLNSSFLDWQVKLRTSRFGHGYYAYNRQYIQSLPIYPVDLSNRKGKAKHDHMVSLVQHMLACHGDLLAAKTPSEKTSLQRQIAATDREIDGLVYELYGLTEEEIRIVEGAAQG